MVLGCCSVSRRLVVFDILRIGLESWRAFEVESMEAWDWLESQSDLRQIAHGCAVLNFLYTVFGLGVPLDLLEELGVDAVIDVCGVDIVDTHAGFVASLEDELIYVVLLEFASLRR
jgi:hypothetical protein